MGQQVMLYQRVTGGWPKNIDMGRPLTDEERAEVARQRQRRNDSTIDNGATTEQMTFLARLYQACSEGATTGDRLFADSCREAFGKGLSYLLEGQYDNGGWPQFWPESEGYHVQITFNDDAMVNTLRLLRNIVEEKDPFGNNLISEELRQQAAKAFQRGIDCILATQIVVDGKPTVWCQQHDRETLQPTFARSYELPSYCSAESAAIVRLLMELPNPDERVRASIEGAMQWFEEHKLTGLRLDRSTGDTRLVPDSTAGPLWARFYDLEYVQPFVCDRDGIPRRHLSEIGSERRNGYSWYNTRPASLFPLYERWKK